MKKFKNLSTGLIEEVNNKAVIEQYEKYPDYYEEVKASNKGADKTEKAGKGENPDTPETPVEEPKAE